MTRCVNVVSRRHALVPCAVLLLALAPTLAYAAPLGTWRSGPTHADGTSVYWNPAALAPGPPGLLGHASFGMSFIDVRYRRAGRDPARADGGPYQKVGFFTVRPDPVAFLGYRFDAPWGPVAVGAGTYVPFGSGADYDQKGGPQRWFIKDGRSFSLFVSPTVATEVWDGLAVSVTAHLSWTSLESHYSTDLGAMVNGLLPPGAAVAPLEHPLLEAPTTVAADGWGAGFGVGLWWRPIDALTFGVAYASETNALVRGGIDVQPSEMFRRTFPGLDPQVSGRIRTTMVLPRFLNVGVSVRPLQLFGDDDRLDVGLDVQWSNDSESRTIKVDVYGATLSFLDGEQLTERGTIDDILFALKGAWRFDERWRVGGRIEWDPAFVPDETMSPANLSFDRLEISAGAEWRIDEHMALTADYGQNIVWDRTITRSLYAPHAPAGSGLGKPSANGQYEAFAGKLTVAFTYGF